MDESRFGDFKWRKPRLVPSLLEGLDARFFLEEYKKLIDEGEEALDVLKPNEKTGVIEGSNPFAVIFTNHILRSSGIRTATPREIESFLQQEVIEPSRVHTDTGIFLRAPEDRRNGDIAKSLYEQVTQRGIETPVLIPLTSLDIVFEEGSQYGFKLRLLPDAVTIPTHNLRAGNFSECNTGGIPIIRESGDRIVYADDSGVARYRNVGRDVVVQGGSFEGSSKAGRIIIVKEFN